MYLGSFETFFDEISTSFHLLLNLFHRYVQYKNNQKCLNFVCDLPDVCDGWYLLHFFVRMLHSLYSLRFFPVWDFNYFIFRIGRKIWWILYLVIFHIDYQNLYSVRKIKYFLLVYQKNSHLMITPYFYMRY